MKFQYGGLLLDLYKITEDLESRAQKRDDFRVLKEDIQRVLDWAETNSANSELINRLDNLLVCLTEASREKVCTNTKCPHYNKKCKMR